MWGWVIAIVVIVLIVAIVWWAIATYNNFIRLQERVSNAIGQVAAQIESRWDALTNLIQATKSYRSHEAETLTKIVRERSGVSRDASVAEIERDDDAFARALRNLNVVVEQYPDLKAASLYQTTMEKVDRYETNVRQARMIYNDIVTRYNQAIKVFPKNLIASLCGFSAKTYFEHTDTKADIPQW